MLADILALISFFIILILLESLVEISPSLMACMVRWKESVNLDASVQLGRSRDIIALAMMLPFCLIVSRYNLYSMTWMNGININGRTGIVIGLFVFYVLLRKFIEHVSRPKKANGKTYRTACKASHTFFSILTLILLCMAGVMSFIDANTIVIKNAMLWVSATIYLLYIVRKYQIFVSSCSFFSGFLYLCALEFIPTGAMVASAIIF